ncbi:MAG TPA: MarR family transcriptional regulator [Asanoa sp.]|nr:MarR family transcriptional regulator [Asanoa sp.]
MAKTRAGMGHHLLPLIEHLARLGRRAAETSMSPGGLRPRHLIALKLLSEHGPAGQQGLADALCLDPSNVVGLLNELEERGLVTRRRDPADRRRHIVELSPSGEDELTLAHSRFAKIEDDLFSALNIEERDTLYHLLARSAGVEPSQCAAAHEPTPDPARPHTGP